jgi:hypothetical protein
LSRQQATKQEGDEEETVHGKEEGGASSAKRNLSVKPNN